MIYLAITAFIGILSSTILVHEFGHYIVAKRHGVPVYEFCVGFPGSYKLFTFYRHNETEFNVRLIPFGGFVRFNNPNTPEQPSTFLQDVSPSKRAEILVAGSAANLLFGFLLLVPLIMFAKGMTFTAAFATFFKIIMLFVKGTASMFVNMEFSDLTGPIGIAGVTSTAVNKGFHAVLALTGLVSLSIGVSNLFPIPGFDGWQLCITAIEGMRGKPLPQKIHNIIAYTSLAVIICLMITVYYNDTVKLVGKKVKTGRNDKFRTVNTSSMVDLK